MIKVAMISPLPAKLGANPESGVAWYALSLAKHLPPSVELHIVAQRSADHLIDSPKIQVLRSWKPGILAAKSITSSLKSIDVDLIHLQHEFGIFGGPLPTAAVVESLRRSRRVKVPIVTTLHGVVPLSNVDDDFLQRNGIPGTPQLARRAFRAALKSVKQMTSMTIVHHQHFKEILASDYGFDYSSIEVVLPGTSIIDRANNVAFSNHFEGRKIKNVLVFGFLTSYKLPELVVDTAVAMKNSPVHFTFCISENPRTDSKNYRERYESLKKSVLALKGTATWSGYIPDDDVPTIFESADLLLLPYVDCISVSAVASLAKSHNVKIGHSAPLRPLFESSDLEFELTVPSLVDIVTKGLEANYIGQKVVAPLISWEESADQTASLWQSLLEQTPKSRR